MKRSTTQLGLFLALILFVLPTVSHAQTSEKKGLFSRLSEQVTATVVESLEEQLPGGSGESMPAFSVPARHASYVSCSSTPDGIACAEAEGLVCPEEIVLWVGDGQGGQTGVTQGIACAPSTPGPDGQCACALDG